MDGRVDVGAAGRLLLVVSETLRAEHLLSTVRAGLLLGAACSGSPGLSAWLLPGAHGGLPAQLAAAGEHLLSINQSRTLRPWC